MCNAYKVERPSITNLVQVVAELFIWTGLTWKRTCQTMVAPLAGAGGALTHGSQNWSILVPNVLGVVHAPLTANCPRTDALCTLASVFFHAILDKVDRVVAEMLRRIAVGEALGLVHVYLEHAAALGFTS
jgi:hypothetical protein